MDIATIVAIVLMIAGFVGLTVMAKLYRDAKLLLKAIDDLMASVAILVAQAKAANLDGKITQAEFDKIMADVDSVCQKATTAMKAGKTVVDDVTKLKDEVTTLISGLNLKGLVVVAKVPDATVVPVVPAPVPPVVKP